MSRNDTGSFQYHSVFISVLSYPNLIPDSFWSIPVSIWSIPVSFRLIPGHSASFRSVPVFSNARRSRKSASDLVKIENQTESQAES